MPTTFIGRTGRTLGPRARRALVVALLGSGLLGVLDAPARALPPSAAPWPVRVREHVDLWLHGFAMLQQDSSLMPYFRLDYRSRLTAERTHLGLTTQLDVNGSKLRERLTANPGLVSAQFVPLYFATWDELKQYVNLFLRVNGDPRGTRDARSADLVAILAAYFPSSADREWLRLFLQSLDDERAKFFDRYWQDEQRIRGPVFDVAERMWRETYGPRFDRFLNNSQQHDGEILVSLPLAGEGRTLTATNHLTSVAVGFPPDTAKAATLIYVFAHEIIGAVANAVVTDNTSPADRRSGAAARYSSLAAVRGGAMLIQRIAPDLATMYQAYYLELARRPVTGGADATARAFAATFPLPDGLRDALSRQIDIILGGI